MPEEVARFLYDNLITTSSMITPLGTASGLISKVQYASEGSATCAITGTYTGASDKQYLIEITTAGEVGAAVFKWSDDGGGTYTTGVTTLGTPILLSNGLSITFTSGAGTDFVLGDIMSFRGFLPNGRGALIHLDPDTEHRSASAAAAMTYVIDLGSAQLPRALILYKHNFRSTAEIRIQGNATDSWGAPTVNEVVTWRLDSIRHYLATGTALRYWRIYVDDTSNPDGYYRLACLYLGGYEQFTSSYELGDKRKKIRRGRRSMMQQGRFNGGVLAVASEFSLRWGTLEDADRTLLLEAFDSTNDLTSMRVRPIFFDPNANLTEALLCEWQDLAEISTHAAMPDHFQAPLTLVEIPRTLQAV